MTASWETARGGTCSARNLWIAGESPELAGKKRGPAGRGNRSGSPTCNAAQRRSVILAPAPDLREVFVVEFDPKPDARPAQKIEKPDARQAEHLSRFGNGDALVGVELEDSLFLDRTNELGFGPLVAGAVGNLTGVKPPYLAAGARFQPST